METFCEGLRPGPDCSEVDVHVVISTTRELAVYLTHVLLSMHAVGVAHNHFLCIPKLSTSIHVKHFRDVCCHLSASVPSKHTSIYLEMAASHGFRFVVPADVAFPEIPIPPLIYDAILCLAAATAILPTPVASAQEPTKISTAPYPARP